MSPYVFNFYLVVMNTIVILVLAMVLGRIHIMPIEAYILSAVVAVLTSLIGVVLLLISPIFSKLMQLAVSRRREFLADATAVEFTRNPDGLISALQKLDADTHKLETANSSTAHMYIANPFKKGANGQKAKTDWFSTHPSIDARIEALRNIK